MLWIYYSVRFSVLSKQNLDPWKDGLLWDSLASYFVVSNMPQLVKCFAYHKNVTCGIHNICPNRYRQQSLYIQVSLNVSHFFLHCPGVQSFSGYCPSTVLLYQAYQRWYSSVVNNSCIHARVVNLDGFPYRWALWKIWLIRAIFFLSGSDNNALHT